MFKEYGRITDSRILIKAPKNLDICPEVLKIKTMAEADAESCLPKGVAHTIKYKIESYITAVGWYAITDAEGISKDVEIIEIG